MIDKYNSSQQRFISGLWLLINSLASWASWSISWSAPAIRVRNTKFTSTIELTLITSANSSALFIDQISLWKHSALQIKFHTRDAIATRFSSTWAIATVTFGFESATAIVFSTSSKSCISSLIVNYLANSIKVNVLTLKLWTFLFFFILLDILVKTFKQLWFMFFKNVLQKLDLNSRITAVNGSTFIVSVGTFFKVIDHIANGGHGCTVGASLGQRANHSTGKHTWSRLEIIFATRRALTSS